MGILTHHMERNSIMLEFWRCFDGVQVKRGFSRFRYVGGLAAPNTPKIFSFE